jgi:hypothetical protein
MSLFKIGDKVKLVNNFYGDNDRNPVWNGQLGQKIGIVSSVGHYICVKWPTYHAYIFYNPTDLSLIDRKRNHPLTSIFRDLPIDKADKVC